MMEQYGYVTSVSGGCARVRVIRESSCGGNCVSCKGCPSEAVVVDCIADDGIKCGDTVKLIMPNTRFFKNMFWGYGQTVILAILGAVFGYVVFGNEGASVLGAGVGLAVGFLTARFVFSGRKCEIRAVKADRENIC